MSEGPRRRSRSEIDRARDMKVVSVKREKELDRSSALTDGIFAVIITIMVLSSRIPDRDDAHALYLLCPDVLSYGISYAFLRWCG